MGTFSPKMNNNFDPNTPNELKIGSNLEEHEWKKCWEQNFDLLIFFGYSDQNMSKRWFFGIF